jgi:hypothetical protein
VVSLQDQEKNKNSFFPPLIFNLFLFLFNNKQQLFLPHVILMCLVSKVFKTICLTIFTVRLLATFLQDNKMT